MRLRTKMNGHSVVTFTWLYSPIERGRRFRLGEPPSLTKRGALSACWTALTLQTGMEFNAKRMKGVFKKYLQFEMDHGDEAGVEAVKAKATEYVTSLVQ